MNLSLILNVSTYIIIITMHKQKSDTYLAIVLYFNRRKQIIEINLKNISLMVNSSFER